MSLSYAEVGKKLIVDRFGMIGNTDDESIAKTSRTDALMAALLKCVYDAAYAIVGPRPDSSHSLGEIPENAGEFPDTDIGDFLYDCEEFDTGVSRYLVVGKRDNYRIISAADVTDEFYLMIPSWAGPDMYATAKEALTARAKSDIEYHAPELEYAQAVLQAIENDDSLEPFINP